MNVDEYEFVCSRDDVWGNLKRESERPMREHLQAEAWRSLWAQAERTGDRKTLKKMSEVLEQVCDEARQK